MNYEELLEKACAKVKREKSGARFQIIKVSGHHEGTKTIVTNFSKIVGCLRRNPEHFIKFLSKELASPSELSGERLIFTRKLNSNEINNKIIKYTSFFVLCPRCKKPDTEIVTEKERSFLKCLACGEKREIHKI